MAFDDLIECVGCHTWQHRQKVCPKCGRRYRISMGGETLDFSTYDRLVQWLWMHCDKWELQSMETVYTTDIPSRKAMVYRVKKIF